jgi:hypothetical protein
MERRGRSRGSFARVGWLAVALSPACAHPPAPPPVEDKARRDVPIAICRKALAGNDVTDAGSPRTEAYWSVLFPGFHGFGAPLDPSARNCIGDALSAPRGGAARASQPISLEDFTLTPDEGGLEAVWLQSLRASDRVASGPLVLARARPAELDVYAIGDYSGSVRHTRFEFARLRETIVLVAHDDGCADVKVDTECQSTNDFYVKAGGRLVLSGATPAQRVQFATLKDLGRVQFRLTSDPPVFDARSITVHEKLSVRDPAGEEVRKVDGDRVLTLRDDGTLSANRDSVWAQVPPR